MLGNIFLTKIGKRGKMFPTYMPILRAKKGEFDTFKHLSEKVKGGTYPVFELPLISEKQKKTKKYTTLSTPISAFVEKCAIELSEIMGDRAFAVDIHRWPSNATIESGEHILSYFIGCLKNNDCKVAPVIGYDRWEDKEYTTVLRLLSRNINNFVIRLDSFAFEDMIEEEPFFVVFDDITSSMDIDSSQCSVLLDFDDTAKTSIIEMQENAQRAIDLLNDYRFSFISIAGCSVSSDINNMVPKTNTDGIVIRKEFKVWKAIRKFNSNISFVFGDYGVANPQVGDNIIAPDANGKIRYTIEDSYFVVRGYSRRKGEKGSQMHGLCRRLMSSGYYMGPDFSWGDSKIKECAQEKFTGNPMNWISIDTSHHMTYVLSEVREYETQLLKEKSREYSF